MKYFFTTTARDSLWLNLTRDVKYSDIVLIRTKVNDAIVFRIAATKWFIFEEVKRLI